MIASLILAVLDRAAPRWLTKPIGTLIDAAAVLAALAVLYFAIEHRGEVKGAARTERRVAKAHVVAVAEARRDEKTAQGTSDRIGAAVIRADDKTTVLLRQTIEELHHELATQIAAPAGAAPAAIDTAVLSASLERRIADANRAADAADAEP